MSRKPGEDLYNPDYLGQVGRVWELDVDPDRTRPEHAAAIGGWLIEAPWAVPAWNYHVASLVHLRDIPGTKPAVITVDGASHELTMWSLDPQYEDQIDPQDTSTLKHVLTPIDMAEQFVSPSDQRALEVVRFAIQKCVDGELIPDTDFRSEWREFLLSQ